MWGHSAGGAECTNTTPRVVAEDIADLLWTPRDVFPNDLGPVVVARRGAMTTASNASVPHQRAPPHPDGRSGDVRAAALSAGRAPPMRQETAGPARTDLRKEPHGPAP